MASRAKAACPNIANHDEGPEGYVNRFDWMVRKSRTHRQRRCPTCKRWAIWEPKSGADHA